MNQMDDVSRGVKHLGHQRFSQQTKQQRYYVHLKNEKKTIFIHTRIMAQSNI